ncbi:hypothetical protein TNCV_661891 [Trichonephila clavipes]|nr:hypothetical protein TNCV_661891 [Trichonephila clavipes]
MMNFVGPDLAHADQVALVITTSNCKAIHYGFQSHRELQAASSIFRSTLLFFSPSRSKAKTVRSSALFLVYRVLCVKPPSVLCATPLQDFVTVSSSIKCRKLIVDLLKRLDASNPTALLTAHATGSSISD